MEQKGENTRTVLVLESDDIALTSDIDVAEKIPDLLAGRLDAPDEIYLAETENCIWYVRPIKRDTEYWLMDSSTGWNSTTFRKEDLIDLKLYGASTTA